MLNLTDKQKDVMKSIVDWYKKPVTESQVYHLYGYAGTGKSTIVNHTIEELKAHGGCTKVVTAAYTGKAVAVLKNKGVPNAETIHRLVYTKIGDDENRKPIFSRKEKFEVTPSDLMVLDECSMIGNKMANDIKALGRKILVIGDPGQLPPFEKDPGFFTRTPEAFLEEIHRQALDSPIIRLATMVRKGEKLPKTFNEGDVWIAPYNAETREALFNNDAQIICGTNGNRRSLTRLIRERFGYQGEMPQIGEPVMCCKNNYRYNFFNGFMGDLRDLQIFGKDVTDQKGVAYVKDDWFIDVYLDDASDEKLFRRILIDPYLFLNHYHDGKLESIESMDKNIRYGVYSEFDYAYVITCHKAQGSGFKNVTVVDDCSELKCDPKKWLYTAITRSESGLTLLHRPTEWRRYR